MLWLWLCPLSSSRWYDFRPLDELLRLSWLNSSLMSPPFLREILRSPNGGERERERERECDRDGDGVRDFCLYRSLPCRWLLLLSSKPVRRALFPNGIMFGLELLPNPRMLPVKLLLLLLLLL